MARNNHPEPVELLRPRNSPVTYPPCVVVIFGGAGDLSHRKLLPALYNLFVDGELPEKLAIVGFSIEDLDDDKYRAFARDGVEKYSRRKPDDEHWSGLAQRLHFVRGSFTESGDYERLKQRLSELDAEVGAGGNRIFYFAIPPGFIEKCSEGLSAAGMVARHVPGLATAHIAALFDAEHGYATPKVDARGAVFDDQGRVLMVREIQDEGRWTLPGGWADVNQTPSECVLREIREESGFEAAIIKLALLHDRARQGHQPAGLFSIYKLFFVCRLTGGAARPSLETSEVRFFARDALPADLSLGRTLPHQLDRLFAHHAAPDLATEFD